MSNSALVDYVRISPNRTSPRNHKIDTITIHCTAGQASVETLGDIFSRPQRRASSNYGIDSDGKIGLYCEEKDRSWCSSNAANDNRAITIEVASDKVNPYKVNDRAMATLIKLLVDICKRNGIKELKWRGDKSLIGQIDRQNMTVHRWFSNTACPGDYLMGKLAWIAEEVNKRLKGSEMVKIRYKGKELEVEGKNENGTVYVKARELLQKMGFSVSWDKESKTVVVE